MTRTIEKNLWEYNAQADHVRGAKYANLLLGADISRGAEVECVRLERVDPAFFRRIELSDRLDPQTDVLYREFKRNPDVISIDAKTELPDEFEPVDRRRDLSTCQQCGGRRPNDPERLRVEITDHTDSTVSGVTRYLCLDCWFELRQESGGNDD